VIRGCAEHVQAVTQPPDAAIFDGTDGLEGRLRVLVRELFAYYARYHWFGRTRCDRYRLPLVEPDEDELSQIRSCLERSGLLAAASA